MEEKKTLNFHDAPVGSVVRHGETALIVRKTPEGKKSCVLCYFNDNPVQCYRMACLPEERLDGRNVHFEEIK